MGHVGRAIPRREDERLLSGDSRFLDDVPVSGVLHAAFVRSPHAHARLLAVRGEGVVLAANALGGIAPPRIDAPPGLEIANEPHPLLADGDVRYAGQPVALVAAESRARAEDLAESIEVAYEPLEPVLDPRAVDPLVRWEKSEGDVAGAFARAAHVVRSDAVLPRVAPAPLEPRGALALPDATVYCSSQSAHRAREQLGQVLGREVRVVAPDVGGGFGSKGTLPVETFVVALAALRLGRPVKWIEDRQENLLAGPQGRGVRGSVELALDRDGRILALRARVLADLGAYLLPSTPIPPHTLAMLITGAYDIPAVEVVVTGARTHRVPTGPYRGAGAAEAAYLIETAVDVASRSLGMDVRARNLVRELPYRTPFGWTYDAGDLSKLGAGAIAVSRSGGLSEYASVREEGGRYVVRSGSTPSGEGLETAFAQIAADALDVELDRVDVRFDAPEGVGSFAARSVAMGGAAVALAARHGEARFEADQGFAFGAYSAEVEVAPTGRVTVTALRAVVDAGTIVNPLLAAEQVRGAAAAALRDLGLEPPPIEVEFVETPSPLSPLGAKSLSEQGAIGAPVAVALAIARVTGVRIDPPYTAERVWRALR